MVLHNNYLHLPLYTEESETTLVNVILKTQIEWGTTSW